MNNPTPQNDIQKSGSTSLPNAVFDALLPTLGDTELRVLLIVARSTLGWKEGSGRKGRDWLSHAQLQRRTGRSGAPVSRAIDTLVKRGLLVVQDEAGRGKGSASERRALRGSLFFRLGDGLLAGVGALPYPAPRVATAQRVTTLQTKEEASDKEEENALSPSSIVLSPEENTVNDPSSLLSPLHFLKTTKETQTKEFKLPLSSLLSSTPTLVSQVEVHSVGENGGSKDWEEETSRFLALFENAYRVARPDDQAALPEEADVAPLCNYFGRGHEQKLEKWLPAFFNCSYGFVRRRHYSFHSYLHCFFILQVHAGALKIKSL